MFKYGLIGKKLSHSYSKYIHHKLGNTEYDLKELTEDEFHLFIKEKSFKAINITIPYKQKIIKYLDDIDNDALEIGSVNTVVNQDGRLKGYNTDIIGLEYLIDKANIKLSNKKVLILGTGGTSKTAYQLCKKLKSKSILKVSRNKNNDIDTITYNDVADKHIDFDVIINTTPSGMFPNIYDKPLSINNYNNLEAVVDVIYNPLRTLLRLDADKKQLKTINGLYMLVAQAVFADSLFFNKKIDKNTIDTIYKELLNNKLNISLIGMPFSGKSTLGKILSDRLNKQFIDVDEYISKKYHKTPSEIITIDGEQKFRDIESEVIREISILDNAIIATGGGVVTRDENIDRLKMTSLMIYIKRDNPIITSDRPLSNNKQMYDELYIKRKPIYERAADYIVDNNDDVELCVENIIKKITNNSVLF